MRAGPLSKPEVVSLLNRHFVPVYVSNEDYRSGGAASPEERAERDRIWRGALEAGHPSGTVHVYIVGADGGPIDSLHVAEASDPARLVAFLERVIARLKLPAGLPVVPPKPQAAKPAAPAGSLVLHLVARGFAGASWEGIPSEDWIVLGKDDQAQLLPPAGASRGTGWEIPPALARKLLLRFYPQTENNHPEENRIQEGKLSAMTLSVAGTRLRARLEGRLRMEHPFYPGRPDGKAVEADLLGYLDIDAGARTVTAFALVAEKARYGSGRMNAALWAVTDR